MGDNRSRTLTEPVGGLDREGYVSAESTSAGFPGLSKYIARLACNVEDVENLKVAAWMDFFKGRQFQRAENILKRYAW